MKRFLLPAGAFVLVLVLTACGAGSVPASQATKPPGVKAIAAARERDALRQAGNLLRSVAVPAAAVRVSRAPAGNQYLSHPWLGTSDVTMTADRSSLWRVHGSTASVIAFMKAHPVAGLKADGSGNAPAQFANVQFGGRSLESRRSLSVVAVPDGGSTLFRVDAGVAWLYPRSASEVVPDDVQEVDIRDKTLHARVTDTAKVAKIVGWFDRLGVSPHGAVVRGCKFLVLATRATFVFRSASGAELAQARVPSIPAEGCFPITFAIGGRHEAPLIDATEPKDAFVTRVERLLGIQLPNR